MAFLILSIIIQVALVVHIIKTGRMLTWVFIVLFFPIVGSLAYFVVEVLPELTGSATGARMRRNMARAVNPDKDLKSASRRLEVADTVQNALAVAGELLGKGRHAEARDVLERSRKGIHASDPALLLMLAQAQFGLGEWAQVIGTLDTMREKNPEHRSADGHMLYARAQQEAGNLDAAAHEYEALCAYFPGPEAPCRLALLLRQRGENARAAELFERVLSESRTAGRHYNTLHREWIALAGREAAAR